MMKSMTGYGRSEYESGGARYAVEIKSVNHRYCDISVRMPKALAALEDRVKRWIQSYVSRGRLDVHISMEKTEEVPAPYDIHWAQVDHYLEMARDLQTKYGLESDFNVHQLLQLPDVLVPRSQVVDAEVHAKPLKDTVDKAAIQLLNMRKNEGQALESDLREFLRHLTTLTDAVMKRAPGVVDEYRSRLRQRLEEWGDESDWDESRLLTEVVVFAEKSDIQEELTRLQSHCSQFERMLASEEPVGRKMDFLIQEMNREVNTIGSKANDLEISQKTVDMKGELEKMREQVQNIE